MPRKVGGGRKGQGENGGRKGRMKEKEIILCYLWGSTDLALGINACKIDVLQVPPWAGSGKFQKVQ